MEAFPLHDGLVPCEASAKDFLQIPSPVSTGESGAFAIDSPSFMEGYLFVDQEVDDFVPLCSPSLQAVGSILHYITVHQIASFVQGKHHLHLADDIILLLQYSRELRGCGTCLSRQAVFRHSRAGLSILKALAICALTLFPR